MPNVFYVFIWDSYWRAKESFLGFHVEVLKGLRVNTLVSRSHSCLLLNKGSFVETLS